MSVRRVRFAIHSEAVGGVLITEDDNARRGWVLHADVPPNALLDLTEGDRVELVLDYEGGESRLVGYVGERSLDSQTGRLLIQGQGGLEPWPDA